jgi:hypothetical protein
MSHLVARLHTTSNSITLQKMDTILVKSALYALKIKVFKKCQLKCVTKLNFFNDFFFLKTSIFKGFKALFTKIVPIFCQLILEFW